MMKKHGNRPSAGHILVCVAVIILALCCLLPMLLVLIISFTDESVLSMYGYSFFPKGLSLDAYITLFRGSSNIWNAYLVSIVVTLTGSVTATLITGMAGYALANRQLACRGGISLFFFITMIFNAGLVPWYIMCRSLGLMNNLFALIIPNLIFSPFNLFLTRNFMQALPSALMESARIDGANDIRIAFGIYFPLSKPVLATVALFYGITYWNDWFNSVMLVTDNKLYTLQFFLYQLQSELSMFKYIAAGLPVAAPPEDTFKMATAVVTIGPIILLYPFLQRYFVKGLVIGGVKG